MTLYEINKTLEEAFYECFDPDTGEILGSTEALDALSIKRDEKLDNIACYIKNLSAEAEAIKAEKMKLDARQKTTEKRIDWLKRYLAMNMEAGEKFQNGRVVISWRKSEAVEIADVNMLPEGYCKMKREPMKADIKKALQDGAVIPGAELVVRQNIQVR